MMAHILIVSLVLSVTGLLILGYVAYSSLHGFNEATSTLNRRLGGLFVWCLVLIGLLVSTQTGAT